MLLTLAVLATVARPAAGDEAACGGHHDLASPLPDECLGVIDTDRPHQTDTPHVLPAGHTQLESAVVAAQLGGRLNDPTQGRGAHVLFFDDNYKFGLTSGVDLQILFKHAEYRVVDRSLVSPGPLQVRAKLNVIEEHGAMPAVTLVPWVFAPVASSQSLRAGPLVFWGWELPARLELEMNAGVLSSTTPKPPLAVVLASALTWTVLGDFRIFADVYATGWDVALGTGALWAFARDMQVDLGTYVGVNGDEPIATPFVGFSVRR